MSGPGRVKLKMQQKSQELGDAKNVECLLRKVMGTVQNPSKRETMKDTKYNTIGVGRQSPLKFTPLPLVLDIKLWD